VGRGGRDIGGEGMRGWMAWSDRTDGVDMWTTKRCIYRDVMVDWNEPRLSLSLYI
jgi:hypothetical protein